MAANSTKNTKLHIAEVLSDLSLQEFKTFLYYLLAREGEPRIRRIHVENKDRLDIADLLVNFFSEEGASREAAQTLKQAGLLKQAKEIAAGEESSAPPPSNPPSNPPPASSGSSGSTLPHSSGPAPSSSSNHTNASVPQACTDASRIYLEIAEFLVKCLNEDGARRVAFETLKQAGFIKQAEELAAGGESSAPPPSNPSSTSSGSSGTSGKHFVDEHRLDLTNRVSNIDPILDELLDEDVIQQETYDTILKLPTTQKKVRELYNGPLKAGKKPKDIFYKSLMKNERYLIDDIKQNN